ncbi:MAG: hypothetical protein ACW99F_16775 [Candidatus Hodarchaeales archaeon]
MNKGKLNICLAAGCERSAPSCCHDVLVKNVTNAELAISFPNAIPVNFVHNLNQQKQIGVYFSDRNPLDDGEGPFYVKIVGKCTNLNKNGGCSKKPSSCLTEKRGGKICSMHRIRDGLTPVDIRFRE